MFKKIVILCAMCALLAGACACTPSEPAPSNAPATFTEKTPVPAATESADPTPLETDGGATPEPTPPAYDAAMTQEDIASAKNAAIAYYAEVLNRTVAPDELELAQNDSSIYNNTYGADAGDVIAFRYAEGDNVRTILLVRNASAEYGFEVMNEGF